jgi:hypothetical protein
MAVMPERLGGADEAALGADGILRGKRVLVVMPATTRRGRSTGRMWRSWHSGSWTSSSSSATRATTTRSRSARRLPHVHAKDTGYGGSQRTCYRLALDARADVVIMVHPDYRYTPMLIPALAGGMPRWRYVGNRVLTLVQNLLVGAKLSEYHTGYRAFAREVLERLPLDANSEGFTFDAEVLAEITWLGYLIGEVSCPRRYTGDASSLSLAGSVAYGIGCVRTALLYRLACWGLVRSPLFPPSEGSTR